MPVGTYERKGKTKDVTEMSKEELKQVEVKAGGKVSPLPPLEGNKAVPIPGTHRVRVGNFVKPALVGHAGTLRDFAKLEIDYEEEGWVPMEWEQMFKYQEQGILVGWNADLKLGLLKKEKSKGRAK
jgi:hypothetical protein